MTDFASAREQVLSTRRDRDDAIAARTALRSALRRTVAELAELDRRIDTSDRGRAARAGLERERAHLTEQLAAADGHITGLLGAEADAVGIFWPFSDPQIAIEQFDDNYPILLMPLRLETRFKAAGDGAVAHDELWVRIFPDDCWIDSFDAAITETEHRNVVAYWTSIWRAGRTEDQERGAWRDLVAAHGSGRSRFLVENFPPSNPADQPTKAAATDVVLPVVSATAFSAAESSALATFWRAAWLATDATSAAAAMSTFEAALGAARAAELAGLTRPANFDDPLPAGTARTDVAVGVAFLVVPDVPTKQNAWSQQPQATVLPDRFVFIGYRTEGDPNPVIVTGGPVPSPLAVGPDPSAAKEDQLRHDDDGRLIVPDEILWTTDFARAVDVGMGLRIDLAEFGATTGFARVLVVGLRLDADPTVGQHELEELLQHHAHRRTGLQVLAQGTPTNNTDGVGSGFDRFDDSDVSFDVNKGPQFTPTSDWSAKADGQWLAELMGIDPAIVAALPGAGGRDQVAGRAMNTALWPATLGYWMESMMSPVFGSEAIEQTRNFFRRNVVGGGTCPTLRIGRQPYGILPTTATARMAWLFHPSIARLDGMAHARRLYTVLRAIDEDFRTKVADIAHVGSPGDPHVTLLDIVGLHPGSVDWSQRYAESLETLFNRLSLYGLGGILSELVTIVQRTAAAAKLHDLGFVGEKNPPLLDLIFDGQHNVLTGGVVDDRPLSEQTGIRGYTDDNRNYIQWLIDTANTSLDALYQQTGFTGGKPPAAVLFLMLRHALQLGYSDVSIRMHEAAGVYTPQQAALARVDEPILHVKENVAVSESRYQPLYAIVPAVTGSETKPMHEFIRERLALFDFEFYLRDQLAALEHLKDMPTAQLERAFSDHVDLCAYRLDAWLQGFIHARLAQMRTLRDAPDVPGADVPAARQGVYIGGYAWLEELRPEQRDVRPKIIDDPGLAAAFAATEPLTTDSANQGYIHAPSLNHAVAAAVLRNGFISNAAPGNPKTLAVNLTSERVRSALSMIEGIRSGQSLGALLGYQFERGLHDAHGMTEVDKHILAIRREFPLAADRFASTKPPEGVSIEAIEANHVIDGLALVEHMQTTKQFTYPFGRSRLPMPIDPGEAAAINAEAQRLMSANDAVADLAISEGVYQAVLGNYDRVASTFDSYAHGNFPPEPDIVRTPLNGIGLTHRVALHLDASASPLVSPTPAVATMTPRAQAEPAINAWLASMLPPLDQIGCVATYRSAATGSLTPANITLDQLGLQPCDLIAMIRDDTEQAMRELDDRIVALALASSTHDPRPDVPVTIAYMQPGDAAFSVFEMMPLTRHLRRLTTRARPLRATDLSLMNEAATRSDAGAAVDRTRIELVVQTATTVRDGLTAFAAGLKVWLDDLTTHRDDILAGIDNAVTTALPLLSRGAELGIPQSGWGFALDGVHRIFAAILDQSHDRVVEWDDKLVEFDELITTANLAPTDVEKGLLLAQAERVISTTSTVDPPSTAAFETQLTTVTRPAFVLRRQGLDDIASTTARTLTALLTQVQALLPLDAFDADPFELTEHEDAIIQLSRDLLAVATVVRDELDRRLGIADDRLAEHTASADPTARLDLLTAAAKALLGEETVLVPQFVLETEAAAELQNAHAETGLLDHLTTPPAPADTIDLPIDEWLFGVARVREPMHAWEQAVVHASSFGRAEPQLEILQLPYRNADHWLALRIPADAQLDTDRLLYTAHHTTPFSPSAPQCGLLLDEWTESIPLLSADTGVAFHADRPNSEAPQTMLLVTPTDLRGTWQWADVVDALNDTLDRAKRRAVEPRHLDDSPYAPFLPATVIAAQVSQLTIALDLALNNSITVQGG